ncbi:hypothetical protein Vafri_20047 [Volvox africanus]|uniref:Uncharacterized protein n=1 Tax=Volvox africanus TaxID=51714 RepID=A0A8J4BRN4_9CHLO|nr:hypothetical protein Vafri_20047 [Volvox africanus]
MDHADASCKLLAAYTGGPSANDVPLGHHLLFGNENIYTFYRSVKQTELGFLHLKVSFSFVQAAAAGSEPNCQTQLRSDRFTRWLDKHTAICSEDMQAIMVLGGSGAGGAA